MVGTVRNRQNVSKFESFQLILLYLLFFTFQYSYAEIHYVSTNGLSIPPFSTWETASDSIQKAINVCSDGDTVYVGNGVYKENIVIDKQIFLCGLSMDSTIIDSREFDTVTVRTNSSTRISNFNLLGNTGWWVVWANSSIEVSNCMISEGGGGIAIISQSGIIDNVIIKNVLEGYKAGCFSGECENYLRNTIIILNRENSSAVRVSVGGDYYQ